MWKYVAQRLKDSTDTTCSHIKNLRSKFSTTHLNVQEQEGKQSVLLIGTSNGPLTQFLEWKTLGGHDAQNKNQIDINTSHIIQQCYGKQRQKQHQQQNLNGPMQLSFFQWTAGFLCSLYFGQMMCFYSRHRQNLKRWQHIEQLLADRSLKQTLDRAGYQKSYVPSNEEPSWYDTSQMRELLHKQLQLVPVSYDHQNQNQQGSAPTFSTATQTTTNENEISLAVENLVATLGRIEFQLGMQNMRADQPEVAVSHLKLATTHRHPEATFNLGVCYELGIGIDKNMKNAMECYRASAALGHKKAMYNLGIFYVHGRGGLKKNREAARACFETAAKMGLRQAKHALRIPEQPIVKRDTQWKSNRLTDTLLNAVQTRESSSV